ncbi:hypothetical protein CSM67_004256 [Salmonella enterica subsp. diarizonae]|nr:hypothetical protein [Salmonella enterica subsp. diarizonae]EDV3465793.1 hypothetical protein [Salmonella enterica subsp. diarizonae]
MKNTLFIGNPYRLIPGKVDKNQFMLIVSISSIRSHKVISALEEYFVYGGNRKEVCDNHQVNQGYLSLKIRRIQEVSLKIHHVSNYII